MNVTGCYASRRHLPAIGARMALKLRLRQVIVALATCSSGPGAHDGLDRSFRTKNINQEFIAVAELVFVPGAILRTALAL